MIRRRPTRALAPLLALWLAACATVNEAPVVDLTDTSRPRAPASAVAAGVVPAAAPGTHVVARGDTLYGIAFRHGLDYRQLADWNRIPPPYTIRPGQVLRLGAPPPLADAGRAEAPRAGSSSAQAAGSPPAADDGTVALAGPDWDENVPPQGEARTFGLDEPAATIAPLPPAGPDRRIAAPDPLPATAPPATTPAPVREAGLPPADAPAPATSAIPADALALRPAPDGAMPPPLPRPSASAPVAATNPEARPAAAPAAPAGALARAVGVPPSPARNPPQSGPAPAVPAAPVTTEPAPAAPAADANLAARRSEPPARIADGPTRSAGGVRWRWPADGTLVGRFAPGDPARQGIDLRGREGAPVVAAADGEVVYSGNGLVGYGELIIIKHSAEFLSAYGHNRRRLVAEGERVRAGQPIAEMGRAPNGFDALHFEIRRAGRPTDPLQFLPPR